jgi:S-adenosylmethionine-diacylglycerol 3-amino-3-carboxypropyl transferase
MAAVLKSRLEQLACGFDIRENYFAWQAFARGYEKSANPSVPPYLLEQNFAELRERGSRVALKHGSMTDVLQASAQQSVDCYVLLDAQDWMNDEVLGALWAEIRRTARPGARVIFRTAANERLLPGRVPQHILDAFRYDRAACEDFSRKDRSSIYGAFHLYELIA